MRLSLSLNEMKLQVTVCTQGDEMLRTAGAFIPLEAIKLEFTFVHVKFLGCLRQKSNVSLW